MMNKYLILVFAGFLAMGCKESGLQQDPNTLPVGDPIEVPLELSFQRTATISKSESEPQTTNEGALAGELRRIE